MSKLLKESTCSTQNNKPHSLITSPADLVRKTTVMNSGISDFHCFYDIDDTYLVHETLLKQVTDDYALIKKKKRPREIPPFS